MLTKPGSVFTLSIPLHPELGPGLLGDQISKAGISLDAFVAALNRKH